MSNTEKKIVAFLIAAFIIGNIVLFIKRERIKRQYGRLTIEEIVTRVDINQATQEELEMLPGIGPVLASRIVEYRRKYGEFRRAEDLLKIDGMSKKVIGQILDLVAFESQP